MELWMKLDCQACGKAFMVNDLEVDDADLDCPHCGEPVEVPEEEQDDQ